MFGTPLKFYILYTEARQFLHVSTQEIVYNVVEISLHFPVLGNTICFLRLDSNIIVKVVKKNMCAVCIAILYLNNTITVISRKRLLWWSLGSSRWRRFMMIRD